MAGSVTDAYPAVNRPTINRQVSTLRRDFRVETRDSRAESCLLPWPEIPGEIDQQNRNVIVRQGSAFEDHFLEQLLPAFRRRAASPHSLQVVANRARIEEDGPALAFGQRAMLLNQVFDENVSCLRGSRALRPSRSSRRRFSPTPLYPWPTSGSAAPCDSR